jgi:hypothetical protein
MLHRKKEFTGLCDPLSNQRGINGFRVPGIDPDADVAPPARRSFR